MPKYLTEKFEKNKRRLFPILKRKQRYSFSKKCHKLTCLSKLKGNFNSSQKKVVKRMKNRKKYILEMIDKNIDPYSK